MSESTPRSGEGFESGLEERLFVPEPEPVTEGELTIVKVGTDAARDWETVQRIMAELRALQGPELNQAVIAVWSRGVQTGLEVSNSTERPTDTMRLRYLSGTGWPEFVHRLGDEADPNGTQAQARPFSLLITREDLRNHRTHARIHEMIRYVLQEGKIIVVNEDDTRSDDEFRKTGAIDFLDNDGLARRLAVDCMATRLIVVTDVPGVYDKDPKAHDDAIKFDRIPAGQPIRASTIGSSPGGRGGMTSKREEIELARNAGIEVFVTDGQPGQIVAAVDRWRPFRGTHLEPHPSVIREA